MNYPTTPGSSFLYRGERYWVISATRSTVLAETEYGQRRNFNLKG